MDRSLIPIEKLKDLLAKDWKAGALRFHAFDATYREKDDEEHAWVRTARALVELTCPEQYRKGMHLLAATAGFMGENVFVVDGNLQDTLQKMHRQCNRDMLLWRNEEVWCATCGSIAIKDDIL